MKQTTVKITFEPGIKDCGGILSRMTIIYITVKIKYIQNIN